MNALAPLLLGAWTWMASLLPFSWCRPLGRAVGWVAGLLGTRSARVTDTNLAHCFPHLSPEELRERSRSSLAHTGALLMEAGLVFHWPEAKLDPLLVKTCGVDQLERALDEPGGVLLLVPHLGNWDFMSLFLGRYQITALYDPPKIRRLDAAIRSARQRTGSILVPIDAGGLRQVYRCLGDGGMVGLLPDQAPSRKSGIYVPFFGQPALTMTLAHRLILSAGPTVFLGAALRCEGGFEVHFRAVGEAVYDDRPEVAIAAMNAEIEQLIELDPDQYQWEYKRFKKPQAGIARLYD